MEFLSERVNKALDSLQILKKNKTKSTESRKKLVKTQNWYISSLEECTSNDVICYITLSNMIWLYISRSLFYYFIDDYFSRTLYAAFRLLVNTCSKNMSCFRIFSGSRIKKEDWPKMVQCSGHNYSATRSSHWTFTKKNGFLRPATLSKKKFQHRCFSLSFTKSLRAPFLQNTSWRLLLHEDTRKKQCS